MISAVCEAHPDRPGTGSTPAAVASPACRASSAILRGIDKPTDISRTGFKVDYDKDGAHTEQSMVHRLITCHKP